MVHFLPFCPSEFAHLINFECEVKHHQLLFLGWVTNKIFKDKVPLYQPNFKLVGPRVGDDQNPNLCCKKFCTSASSDGQLSARACSGQTLGFVSIRVRVCVCGCVSCAEENSSSIRQILKPLWLQIMDRVQLCTLQYEKN